MRGQKHDKTQGDREIDVRLNLLEAPEPVPVKPHQRGRLSMSRARAIQMCYGRRVKAHEIPILPREPRQLRNAEREKLSSLGKKSIATVYPVSNVQP